MAWAEYVFLVYCSTCVKWYTVLQVCFFVRFALIQISMVTSQNISQIFGEYDVDPSVNGMKSKNTSNIYQSF